MRVRPLRRRLIRRTRPRFRGLSFNRLIPNLMTLVGLCVGLTGIRFAFEGRWSAAVIAVAVAALIDGLDGRLARLLKGTSRFGAEFDSLSDFLCFGVAPALILFLWTMSGAGGIGWALCMVYAVCAALRLARFNAAIDGTPRPSYAYNFFQGVPAPAGAALCLLPMVASFQAREWGAPALSEALRHPITNGVALLGVASLMVSTLPTYSFKNFKVPEEWVLPGFLGVVVFATFLMSEPWGAMVAAGLVYLGMVPFSYRSHARLRAEAEAMAKQAEGPQLVGGLRPTANTSTRESANAGLSMGAFAAAPAGAPGQPPAAPEDGASALAAANQPAASPGAGQTPPQVPPQSPSPTQAAS